MLRLVLFVVHLGRWCLHWEGSWYVSQLLVARAPNMRGASVPCDGNKNRNMFARSFSCLRGKGMQECGLRRHRTRQSFFFCTSSNAMSHPQNPCQALVLSCASSRAIGGGCELVQQMPPLQLQLLTAHSQ